MDFSRILERLRDKLSQKRSRIALAVVLPLTLVAVTIAAGFVLLQRAVDDTRPPVASVVNVPTQVGLLFSFDKPNEVVNHIVYFNDVHLQPGPTEDIYYAGGEAGPRVLVLSQGMKTPSGNAEVDIKGTVRILPSAYTLKNKWKLSKEERELARKLGIYVEADEIITRHATPGHVARK